MGLWSELKVQLSRIDGVCKERHESKDSISKERLE